MDTTVIVKSTCLYKNWSIRIQSNMLTSPPVITVNTKVKRQAKVLVFINLLQWKQLPRRQRLVDAIFAWTRILFMVARIPAVIAIVKGRHLCKGKLLQLGLTFNSDWGSTDFRRLCCFVYGSDHVTIVRRDLSTGRSTFSWATTH